MLKYYVELNLSLSEQIILKKIVSKSIGELNEINYPRNKFQPSVEGAVRFLFEEYNLSPDMNQFYEPIISGQYTPKIGIFLNQIQFEKNFI